MMDTTKLKRDYYSNAVINTDTISFRRFVSEQNQSRELKKALREVGSLRKDVDDIKSMLITLINGTNKNG
jgi:ABC-type phosphate transport system auxiliary subunit